MAQIMIELAQPEQTLNLQGFLLCQLGNFSVSYKLGAGCLSGQLNQLVTKPC